MHALRIIVFAHPAENFFSNEGHRGCDENRGHAKYVAQCCERCTLVRPFFFEPIPRPSHVPCREIINKERERSNSRIKFVFFISRCCLLDQFPETSKHPAIECVVTFVRRWSAVFIQFVEREYVRE